MPTVPSHLKFTTDHEWLAIDGDVATVGITAFAAEQLGDVVYLDLPAIGSTVSAGDACGEIESTKSVSDLNAPADGEVVEVNTVALDDPGVLNQDPHETGWLFRMRLSGSPELMDAAAYQHLIGAVGP